MTKSIAAIDPALDDWSTVWTRVNQIANVISTSVLTVDEDVPTGNAVVNGSIQSVTLYANTISGGTIGSSGLLTISSNTTIAGSKSTVSANVSFTGANVTFASAGSLRVPGSNSSHFVLASNTTTGALYFVNAVGSLENLSDTAFTSQANNDLMRWDNAGSEWVNMTPADLVNLIEDVDGDGSGLDADKLDGFHGTQLELSNTNIGTDDIPVRSSVGDLSGNRYVGANTFYTHHAQAERASDTIFYSSTNNYIYKNNQAGFRTSLDVYSKSETDAKILEVYDSTGTQIHP